MENLDSLHIGYIAVRNSKDGDGYIGSPLVIDEMGVSVIHIAQYEERPSARFDSDSADQTGDTIIVVAP